MDTIQVSGFVFKVTVEFDSDSGCPWEREDGHGVISDWLYRDKRAGERVLREERGASMFYDVAASMAKAKAEGWDAAPYGGTRGEKAVRAVEADFQRMRDWLDNRWSYVGVIVERLDDEGVPDGDLLSLWGIESDALEYIRSTAHELAEELAAPLLIQQATIDHKAHAYGMP